MKKDTIDTKEFHLKKTVEVERRFLEERIKVQKEADAQVKEMEMRAQEVKNKSSNIVIIKI